MSEKTLAAASISVRRRVNDVNSGMTVPLKVKLSWVTGEGSLPKWKSAERYGGMVWTVQPFSPGVGAKAGFKSSWYPRFIDYKKAFEVSL